MKRNVIKPIGLLAVGTAIDVNGQRFDLVAHEERITATGTSTVMVWQAECLECGEGFRSWTMPGRFAETRRCEEHRRLGRPSGATAHA